MAGSFRKRRGGETSPDERTPFHDAFVALYEGQFPGLLRFLARLTGDGERASDLAQEAFVRLHRRSAMPDSPGAWLVTVALNLMRNERATRLRRARLLDRVPGERLVGDAPPDPEAAGDAAKLRARVRGALDRLSERDRQLLLLRAEGYGYRDLARILELNEASVGVFLARARNAFLAVYPEDDDASR